MSPSSSSRVGPSCGRAVTWLASSCVGHERVVLRQRIRDRARSPGGRRRGRARGRAWRRGRQSGAGTGPCRRPGRERRSARLSTGGSDRGPRETASNRAATSVPTTSSKVSDRVRPSSARSATPASVKPCLIESDAPGRTWDSCGRGRRRSAGCRPPLALPRRPTSDGGSAAGPSAGPGVIGSEQSGSTHGTSEGMASAVVMYAVSVFRTHSSRSQGGIINTSANVLLSPTNTTKTRYPISPASRPAEERRECRHLDSGAKVKVPAVVQEAALAATLGHGTSPELCEPRAELGRPTERVDDEFAPPPSGRPSYVRR